MGCASCSAGGCGVSSTDDKSNPSGCKGEGSCGCNKMNTYDWLSDIELPKYNEFDVVEVSFKNGARKGFYVNQSFVRAETGDNVVVESGNGYDVGTITLSGELVRLQMKKKKVSKSQVLPNIIRRSNQRDFERLKEARGLEQQSMVKARVISRTLKLDMKIGDVEYQGDKRKATFYYTADGRVDFRELIKQYAKEFKVKIEMRQIGARQESARIGGLGSCGRELCCSTWLTDFKSVSTAAARYQNLAINQAKLSGQCGRLKCCLNYELDTYMDALTDFPKKADYLLTEAGKATLVKTDIFKRTMYYQYRGGKNTKFYPLKVERVKEVLALNATGEKPMELMPVGYNLTAATIEEPDYEAVNDVLELAPMEKRKRRRKNRSGSKSKPLQEQDNKQKPETPRVSSKRNLRKPTSTPKAKEEQKQTNKSINKPSQKIDKKPQRQNKPKPTENDTSNANQQPKAGVNKPKPRPRLKKPVNPVANKPQNPPVEDKTNEGNPPNTTENKNFKRRRRNRNRNRNNNNNSSDS
ncbi:MAG: cell fate regulator YaaT (PSP1 superfamily) [Cognaticolwellia sp.]|jgi:cell fate regulator YaaT (PSP1 superfamily)